MSIASKIVGYLGGIYNLFPIGGTSGGVKVQQIGTPANSLNFSVASNVATIASSAGCIGGISITPAAGTLQLGTGVGFGFSTTFGGIASGVIAPGSTIWFQHTSGESRVTTSDLTNATSTMSNITGCSATLIAGRKYAGRLVVFCAESAAAEGIMFDFDGGGSTMTSFRSSLYVPQGGTTVLGVVTSTAIATDLTVTTLTGDSLVIIEFTLVCNGAGTFIPRFAQVSHAAGTATVYVGTNMSIRDVP